MSATVDNCINKCDFICTVYNDIISQEFGLDCKSCGEDEVTLCNVLEYPSSVTVSTDPSSVTHSTTTVVSSTCNVILQEQTITNSMILIEI